MMFNSSVILVLMSSILCLLSSNAVSSRRDKSILYARSAMLILAICFIVSINIYNNDFYDTNLGLYHGLFHNTATSHIFHIFIFIICVLIVQLNAFYGRKVILNKQRITNTVKSVYYKLIYINNYILNKMSEQYRIIEYPLIILFVVTGGVFLISSCDLISLFLSIELQSYGLYILCSAYRNSEKATTAGLTYFLLGGLSSCFILLSSSLLYGNSGNTSFDSIYIINNISNSIETSNQTLSTLDIWYQYNYINIALIIMSVGLLFKVTAAPFHFWSPDVYDSIPTIVTTFVAIFAKISIFILLLELVHYTGNFYATENELDNNLFNFSWTISLLISSLLSLIIGSIMGLTQFRIKRLYAYSTISHVGFILLALTINSIESIQSFLFYLMQYSLSNLNAFIILITIGYSLYLYKEKGKNRIEDNETKSEDQITEKKNSPIQLINQIKGYFYANSAVAISLAVTVFSFAGIPPLIGFFAKQMVLSSALDSGYVFMALIAILTSVISAYYYLALIKKMFFSNSNYIINSQLDNVYLTANIITKNNNNMVKNTINISLDDISLNSNLSIIISTITLSILLFILNPQEWLSLTNVLSLILFNC